MRWPAARVTGIDFSATSVRCTEELKRKYKLDNLQVHQLPIERVARIGDDASTRSSAPGCFIICADPDAGLRALRDVLEPDGAMHSWCMRRTDGPASTCCRSSAGESASAPPMPRFAISSMRSRRCRPGIRCRTCCARPRISGTRRRSPTRCCIRSDRAYSVPQLFEFLDSGRPEIRPMGATGGLQPSVRRHGAASRRRRGWHSFPGRSVRRRRTVSRHDGSSQRDCISRRQPDSAQRISFAGDAWLTYVPIRMPDTMCVHERLPPGAAAVLINQSHTYHDIYLPIDATEMRLLDAIDGDRSIGDIVDQALPSLQQASASRQGARLL